MPDYDAGNFRYFFRDQAMTGHRAPRASTAEDDDALPTMAPEPKISRCKGKRSGAALLWVDGLGVAAVSDAQQLEEVADDLRDVMKAENLLNGSLLVSSRVILPTGQRHSLASDGISVRGSQGRDLISAATRMLKTFWDHRLVVRDNMAKI